MESRRGNGANLRGRSRAGGAQLVGLHLKGANGGVELKQVIHQCRVVIGKVGIEPPLRGVEGVRRGITALHNLAAVGHPQLELLGQLEVEVSDMGTMTSRGAIEH